MTGLGATRRSQDNINNDAAGGWIPVIVSCLAKLKPFSVRFTFDTNKIAWIANMTAKMGTIAITWPLEGGYTGGGTLSFAGALTDFTFGAANLEGILEGEMTITPSGPPTAVAGTVAS